MNDTDSQSNPKRLVGTVVSTDMEKTATVLVGRFVQHPKYLKYISKEKQYLVHDPAEEVTVGDEVVIEETLPISKKKRFRVVERLTE